MHVGEVKASRGGEQRETTDEGCRDALADAAKEAVSDFRYMRMLEQGKPVAAQDVAATITFELAD